MSKKEIIFLLLVFITYLQSFSQSNVSLNLTAIGFHLFDKPNINIYENKLDSNGNFNTEPGLILSFELYTRENYSSIQLTQGIYSDAAAQEAGFTFVGFRRRFYHKYKNQWSIAIGPVVAYRRDWTQILGYIPEKGYTKNGRFEYRLWGFAELEYNYLLNKRSDLCFSIIYGYSTPDAFTFTLGYKFWINPNIKRTKDCNCGGSFKKKKFGDWFK